MESWSPVDVLLHKCIITARIPHQTCQPRLLSPLAPNGFRFARRLFGIKLTLNLMPNPFNLSPKTSKHSPLCLSRALPATNPTWGGCKRLELAVNSLRVPWFRVLPPSGLDSVPPLLPASTAVAVPWHPGARLFRPLLRFYRFIKLSFKAKKLQNNRAHCPERGTNEDGTKSFEMLTATLNSPRSPLRAFSSWTTTRTGTDL